MRWIDCILFVLATEDRYLDSRQIFNKIFELNLKELEKAKYSTISQTINRYLKRNSSCGIKIIKQKPNLYYLDKNIFSASIGSLLKHDVIVNPLSFSKHSFDLGFSVKNFNVGLGKQKFTNNAGIFGGRLHFSIEAEKKLKEESFAPKEFIDNVNAALISHIANPVAEDDLQKNRWGKSSNNNGKQFNATVIESKKLQRFFDVQLKVSSNEKDKPLLGWVAFFVHDSFGFEKDTIYARAMNGLAFVSLIAYEAFTAGALCEDGTELELDLNELTNMPENFHWKNA